ncbi:MAG: GMP/IMP nucleotidase [Gammaproteobacteria bacterium]
MVLKFESAGDRLDRPRWEEVEIVLLDMDGTLLDLSFDNYFWQELVPLRYANRYGISLRRAQEMLAPRFEACRGRLEWYCLEHWSRELALDIIELKQEARERVRFLPGAETFLQFLRARGLRTALVTNAHQASLAVKAAQTGLLRYFDDVISSHMFGFPKEDAGFWTALRERLQFEPSRALFVDDSPAVLRAAQRFGIGQIFAVSHPDSEQEARPLVEFPSVRRVAELIGGWTTGE